MRPIYQPCGGIGKDPQTLAFNNAVQSVIAAAAEMKEHLDLADALLAKGRSEELVTAIEALAGQERVLLDAASRLVAADAARDAMLARKNAPPQPPAG